MDFKIALLKDKQKTPGSIQAVIKDRLREWLRRVVTRLKSIQAVIKDGPKMAQLYGAIRQNKANSKLRRRNEIY